MIAEFILLGMLLLLAAILGVRSALRSRCLGKCAGCPYARACAREQKAEKHT